MNNTLIVASILIGSLSANAYQQKDLKIPALCGKEVKKAVLEEVSKGDPTFSIIGLKLLYGGVREGFSLPMLILVQSSDEVEPRDVLVRADAKSVGRRANMTCDVHIDQIEVLADGSTLDVPDAELIK